MFCVAAVRLAPAGQAAAAEGFLVTWLVVICVTTRFGVRRRVRRRLARHDVKRIPAPALSAALVPAGVAHLTVAFVPPGDRIAGRSAGRAFRTGRAAAIILRPALQRAQPDLARFVVAHEAAHVARNDTLAYTIAYGGLASLAAALVGSGAFTAVWLLIPAYAAQVGLRWFTELACDRVAARTLGPGPGAAFTAYLDRARAAARAKPGSTGRLLAGRLTHPPAALRRAVITRAAG